LPRSNLSVSVPQLLAPRAPHVALDHLAHGSAQPIGRDGVEFDALVTEALGRAARSTSWSGSAIATAAPPNNVMSAAGASRKLRPAFF